MKNFKVAVVQHYTASKNADFDIDEIREYRSDEDLGKYRKINAYKNLMKFKDKNG